MYAFYVSLLILIVCQRWRHGEKNKNCITFGLDVILKVIVFKGASTEKTKLHALSGVHHRFKKEKHCAIEYPQDKVCYRYLVVYYSTTRWK